MLWFKKRTRPQPPTGSTITKQPEAKADLSLSRASVSGSGSATIRQRPSLLLMKFPFKAAEATLELGLAKLKDQREAAAQWLERLGAARIEFGEPHFADQAEMDPLTRARVLPSKVLGKQFAKASSGGREQGVRVVLTAFWDVQDMSGEETLKLLDRLRFETAEDVGAAEAAEEPPPWTSPEDRLGSITSQLFSQLPADQEGPKFLFIARVGEEQWAKAAAEAFTRARRSVDQLARAAGMQLTGIPRLHLVVGPAADHRPDKMMERQRCAALLAGCSYDLRENEIVSDAPRSVEFTVSVNVTYSLEEISPDGGIAGSEADPPLRIEL